MRCEQGGSSIKIGFNISILLQSHLEDSWKVWANMTKIILSNLGFAQNAATSYHKVLDFKGKWHTLFFWKTINKYMISCLSALSEKWPEKTLRSIGWMSSFAASSCLHFWKEKSYWLSRTEPKWSLLTWALD